jgi:hypothetical protein
MRDTARAFVEASLCEQYHQAKDASKKTERGFVLCVRHDDCEDLERWKVYHILMDEKAERMVYLLNRRRACCVEGYQSLHIPTD